MTAVMQIRKNNFFILGAVDPEMRSIEFLLKKNDVAYQYAGCSHRTAYTYVIPIDDIPPEELEGRKNIVFVECAPLAALKGLSVQVIDHHLPGQEAYKLGGEHFEEASSLGQIARKLGIHLSRHEKVIAAADHCLADALAGGICPGIDPDAVVEHKIHAIIHDYHTGENYERIAKSVKDTEDAIDRSPIVELFGLQIVCYAATTFKTHEYSSPLLIAQLAAARRGVPCLFRQDDGSGWVKYTLSGNVPLKMIELFIQAGKKLGLRDVYGCPHRRYAGAYHYYPRENKTSPHDQTKKLLALLNSAL